MNAELIEMAKALGAVDYSPPPMRAVRGLSFTFEQFEALALRLMAPAEEPHPCYIAARNELLDDIADLRDEVTSTGGDQRVADVLGQALNWIEGQPSTEADDGGRPDTSQDAEEISEADGWPSPIVGLILNARSDAISLREAAQGKPAPAPFNQLSYREYLERIADSLDVAINSAEAFMRTTAFPRGTVAGYVIEHADGDRWRTMDSLGMPVWTDDIAKALCVTIREHAERLSEDDPEDIRIKAAQPTPLHLRVIESPLDVQFATANDAELTEGLWTFKMIGNDWRVAAGEFAIVPANKYRELAQDAAELRTGLWVRGDDMMRNVKALDKALNGPGGATRPLLIDILCQVEGEVRRRGAPILSTPGPFTIPPDCNVGDWRAAVRNVYSLARLHDHEIPDNWLDAMRDMLLAVVNTPTCGVLAGEPEIVGERCLDGGRCHHGCTDTCDRRDGCVPLTASGLTDQWTAPT